MGEYWKAVNVTRHEFIHPHAVGCGLKLPEWNRPGSRVRQIMEERWAPTDDVRAISDYENYIQLTGTPSDERVVWDDLWNDHYGYRPMDKADADEAAAEHGDDLPRFVMITDARFKGLRE